MEFKIISSSTYDPKIHKLFHDLNMHLAKFMRITEVELFRCEQPVYKFLTKIHCNDFESAGTITVKLLGAEKFASDLNKSTPCSMFSRNCNEQEISLDYPLRFVEADEHIAKLNDENIFEQTNQTVPSSLATGQSPLCE